MRVEEEANVLLSRVSSALLRFLFAAPTRSEWAIEMGAEAASEGMFTIGSVAGEETSVLLRKEAEKVTMRYSVVGSGVGLGLGVPLDSSLVQMPWPDAGRLYIRPGSDDFAEADDVVASEIAGAPCVLVSADGTVFVDGSLAVMLVGVNPMLVWTLRRLGGHCKRLWALSKHRGPMDALETGSLGDGQAWSFRSTADEIADLLMRLEFIGMSAGMVRAELVAKGLHGGISSGRGLTAYFGTIREVKKQARDSNLFGTKPTSNTTNARNESR